MASITKQVEVEVDFDAEDYLNEIEDKRLIEEIEDRGYYVEGKEEDECRKRMPAEYTIRRDFDRHKLRDHLLNLTGQGSYVSDDELLERIKELLIYG